MSVNKIQQEGGVKNNPTIYRCPLMVIYTKKMSNFWQDFANNVAGFKNNKRYAHIIKVWPPTAHPVEFE